MLVWGAFLFAERVRNWERGAPDGGARPPRTSSAASATSAPACTCARCCATRPPGVMHSMIYFGFLVLLGGHHGARGRPPDARARQVPPRQAPTRRTRRSATSRASCSSSGSCGRIVRRYVQRPYRIRIKTKPEHAVILGTFFVDRRDRGSSPRAFRIAEIQRARLREVELHRLPAEPSIVDGLAPNTLDSLAPGHRGSLHVVAFVVFLAILPITMLRHMFTSPLNMYLRDRDRPKGAMKAMPNLTETSLETFGASVVEDFTWKQLLDTDACTMCGRCTQRVPGPRHRQAARPARDRVEDGRGHGGHGAARSRSARRSASTTRSPSRRNSLFERITAEEVWACTSCKACDEICPVNIEILDKILDMRRYLSLMESNFPAELGNAYRAMENQGNPWGMNQGERGDWAKDLDGVTIVDPGRAARRRVPLLGRLRRYRSTTRTRRSPRRWPSCSQRAGIDVAILGPVGDVHRRLRPAAAATSTCSRCWRCRTSRCSTAWACKKIITQCPHCFNTLKNEYPQLGGNYEVVHHSQLLESLIESGQARRLRGHARGADHLPRLVLPRPPQRRLPRAAQGRRLDQGHRGRRDAAQRHQGHVLRRRWGADVDGGDDRHEGQRRAGAGGDLHRRLRGSPPRARSATSCSTTA